MKTKNKNIKLITLFLTIILSSNSLPQCLDSLIFEAIQNNPQLKSIEEKVKSAYFRSETVNSLPPPTIGVEFSQVPINKYNIWDNAFSNNIFISQMFMLGGKLQAMSSVERNNAIIETNNYDIYKNNLIAQIKMEYYSFWMIDRKIEIQEEILALQDQLLNSITQSITTNMSSQSDIILLKSAIASDKIQLFNLNNQREATFYKINKLLGRNLESKKLFVAKEVKDTILTLSENDLVEKILAANPSLKRMDNMIEMNKAMIIAINKELVPDLMIQGMFMRIPQGMTLTTKTDLSMLSMERPKTEYMYSIMASITLPFVPWSSNKISNKESELFAGIKSAELEKIDMYREMTAKVKELITKFRTSKQMASLYNETVIPLNNLAINTQLAEYQNNKRNIIIIIESMKMLLMNKMNYYMALSEMLMTKAEIEMMIGGQL